MPRDGSVAKSLADYLAEQLPKVNRKTIEQLPRESQEWLQGSLNSSVHGKAFRNAIQKDEDLYDVLTLKKDKSNLNDLIDEQQDENGIKVGGKYSEIAEADTYKNPCKKKLLGISDLEVYKVEKQVHMYVNKQKQQYMVADLILYKTDGKKVTNMIIIEIKLKSTTQYTIRQKKTFKNLIKEIELVKAEEEAAKLARARGEEITTNSLVNVYIRGEKRKRIFGVDGDALHLKNVKLLRISGDGTTSLDNVKIEEITQITE